MSRSTHLWGSVGLFFVSLLLLLLSASLNLALPGLVPSLLVLLFVSAISAFAAVLRKKSGASDAGMSFASDREGAELLWAASGKAFELGGRPLTWDELIRLEQDGALIWQSEPKHKLAMGRAYEAQKRAAQTGLVTDSGVAGETSPASRRRSSVLALLVLAVAVAGSLGVFASCSHRPAATDNPTLAADIRTAIASEGGAAGIHDVAADGSGKAILTLAVRKSDLGGEVNAEDTAHAVANLVLSKVSGVTQVAVFDADRSMIDVYRRK